MSGVRPAFAKCGLARAIIGAFAQALDHSILRQARQCLRNSRKRLVAKILKTPQALPTFFDALANQCRGVARRGCMCVALFHA